VLSENIPTARGVIIGDAGHFPHMEKPETVNEVLSEWLEEKVNRS
jgi:pimeloyl-ACP methyl ester carboxylesterase